MCRLVVFQRICSFCGQPARTWTAKARCWRVRLAFGRRKRRWGACHTSQTLQMQQLSPSICAGCNDFLRGVETAYTQSPTSHE